MLFIFTPWLCMFSCFTVRVSLWPQQNTLLVFTTPYQYCKFWKRKSNVKSLNHAVNFHNCLVLETKNTWNLVTVIIRLFMAPHLLRHKDVFISSHTHTHTHTGDNSALWLLLQHKTRFCLMQLTESNVSCVCLWSAATVCPATHS